LVEFALVELALARERLRVAFGRRPSVPVPLAAVGS
jgi:hypothetical protein